MCLYTGSIVGHEGQAGVSSMRSRAAQQLYNMYRTMMVMVVAEFGFAFLSSIPWIHAHLIWVLWWMLVLVGACCSVLLVVFYIR